MIHYGSVVSVTTEQSAVFNRHRKVYSR
jgi:hypothetical protein